MTPRVYRHRGLALLCLLLASACTTIPKDFKEPSVALVSITPDVTNLFAPEFDIVLRVTNPNRTALSVAGLSYTIDMQGNRLIQGVASELPEIPAYGEADVRLRATADLVGGIGFISGLMTRDEPTVDFELNADLDLGTFYPTVNIRRSGSIALF